MRNYNLITVLLLSLSWICISSESQIVGVLHSEEVTLLCSKFSSSATQIYWFRVVKKSMPRCVSFMFEPLEPASFCDGFDNETFEMTSNPSTVSLKIKELNSSDSGLYFCEYKITRKIVIVNATFLEVREAFDRSSKLLSYILCGVVIFLLVIIIFPVKMLQKAHVADQNPQQSQGSNDLNYAAVTFRLAEGNQRPAAQREVEPNVIYSATR
ncbi:LOW QUALITY PROTEIN: uncharacterized protein LOC134876315 [Eleginops maclovinus]|uniref:LOW QUALITY PROTEIN: uncharacterized protein LOC134876315 n=1 Tax=Eleginops maclovinus TaxID=56733 RepID=UPI0030808B2E